MTTPVLVADGEVVGESEDIVRWADRHLAAERRVVPEDAGAREDALSLSRAFDRGLGQAGRRLIYALMLPHPQEMLAINNQGLPEWEERLARTAWPAITLAVRIRLRMPSKEPDPRDERIAREAFDAVAERLADGRAYLCGERFSIADLTFAALAAPVIGSPRYGIELPGPDELPPEVGRLVRRFREHPAGRFALRVIESERPFRAGAAAGGAGTTSTAASRSPGRSRRRSGPTASR
jgi:glutathione S-transferase